jgi:hypothetical protein
VRFAQNEKPRYRDCNALKGKNMLKKESLFNIWVDGQHSKTTIFAHNMNEALDIFCAKHGFVDHVDYCQAKNLNESNINIEIVRD